MKKSIIVSILAFLAIVGTAKAGLWQYYEERGEALPSVKDRISVASNCGIEGYTGTADQNVLLEQCLKGEPMVGVSLPTVVANYNDSLATKLPKTGAATFTLIRGKDKLNRTLNGYYGFVIDEGTASEEYITANCVGVTCTIVTRGIDIVSGVSNTSTLQFQHNRAASAKITDFPQIALLSRIFTGQETTPGGLTLGTNSIYLATSTAIRSYNGILQWSTDGFLNSYNFTSSSVSQLMASTTRGIGVTNSLIHINASSTTGMAFDSAGNLYQKTLSTLSSSANGLGVNTTSDYAWSGSHTFTSTTSFLGTVNGLGTANWFGDGRDGNLEVTTTTLITSDKYFNNLTVSSTGTLYPNGYRIYVKGTLTNNGVISADATSDGGNGTNASGSTPGSAGAAGVNATSTGLALPQVFAGQNGVFNGGYSQCGTCNNLSALPTPTTTLLCLGTQGGAGGTGNGAPAGVKGTCQPPMFYPILPMFAAVFSDFTTNSKYQANSAGSASNAGCGGWSCSSGDSWGSVSGGSGGGGGNAGVILINAKILTGNGTFTAKGKNGGNGGNANTYSASCSYSNNCRGSGGGGTGAGGNGGLIMIGYGVNNFVGTATATPGIAGQTPGTGASGYGSGGSWGTGTVGGNGATGTIMYYQF